MRLCNSLSHRDKRDSGSFFSFFNSIIIFWHQVCARRGSTRGKGTLQGCLSSWKSSPAMRETWSWGKRSITSKMWPTPWRASYPKQKMLCWPRSSIRTGCLLWVRVVSDLGGRGGRTGCFEMKIWKLLGFDVLIYYTLNNFSCKMFKKYQKMVVWFWWILESSFL